MKKYGVKNIKLQKDVFNPQLYFQLLTLSKMGDLGRMTQYKSCKEEDRTGQLLTYPVLMAHDIAGYKEVCVGLDQEQHLQYTCKLLRKYNDVYKTDYPIPVANMISGKIKDLKDPSKKMSKSSPKGCLFLDDTPDDIRHKIRKATANEEGLSNLRFLYSKFVGNDYPEQNQKLKEELSEAIIGIF